ncbi:MAG: hypothetical protein ABSF34_05685 [Verrucomicrobiota bacterium]
MKIKQQYRQGDVLIERVAEIPVTALKQEMSRRVILAHGEVTGHHHVLESADPTDWWKQGEIPTTNKKPAALAGELFLSLPQCASVTHPEHATIELPPGSYRVVRQREYSPEAIRQVHD